MTTHPTPTLLQRGRIEREGESIYYELATRGEDDHRPVVVLSHGAGGSHAVWFHQVLPLGERFRVLTWDSRGFGNSTFAGGSLSVAAAVGDLAAVLDAIGLAADEAVHLVGQSMGGWWSVGFALAHPHRVRSLTLSDTPGGVWTEALRGHFRTARPGRLTSDVVGVHQALGATTMRERPAQAFLYQQLGSFFTPPMGAVGKMLAEVEVDPAAVRAVGCPLLVVAGEEDAIFPAAGLKGLADVLGARYVELAGAGHSPYFESPDAYNEALLDFLV
ncbi:MAG: alpha/beta fold hydrolase [Acidimicrobiia bacterium]